MVKRLVSNRGLNWSFLDQALISAVNFLSTVLLARMLDIEEFGLYATIWLVLLFINSVHAAVIVLPMMTLVPKEKRKARYFGSALVLQMFFLLGSFIISSAITYGYFSFAGITAGLDTIMLFIVVLISYHMQDFYRRYFFAIKSYSYAFVIDVVSYLVRLMILFVLIMIGYNLTLNDVLLIFAVTYMAGVIFGLYFYKYEIDKNYIFIDFKKHWELAKWLLPSSIMHWSSVNLFIIAAAVILGPMAVGVIKIGQNIVGVFNVLIQGLENFVPSEAHDKYKSSGFDGLYKYIVKVIFIGVMFLSFFGLIISVFSREIIFYVYGNKYIGYESIVIWSFFVFLLVFVSIPVRIMFRTLSKTKLWFAAYVIATIFSILVFYPLEINYGLNGAMFGMFFTYVVLLGSSAIMLFKEKENYVNFKK